MHNWDNFIGTPVLIPRELTCKPYTIGKGLRVYFSMPQTMRNSDFYRENYGCFPPPEVFMLKI